MSDDTEPEPVELLEPVLVDAPDVLMPVVLELDEPDALVPVVSEEPDAVVPVVSEEADEAVELGEVTAGVVRAVVRDSAGSCPVTSTTVITAHTARNSATE